MEPFLLDPAGKDYLWGGTRLKTEYGKHIDLTPLAETWECSVHPDGPSIVRAGSYAGMKLSDVLKEHPEYLGTKIPAGSDFPILVKFIDAYQDLSVQVHPSDEYAWEKENHQRGKTEMWYVLEAEPGAKLVCGFLHPVTPEILKKGVEEGNLSKHLQFVDVHQGDVFFIRSGTIHAIGAGILLCEIQESSNLTYRVYDYNRRGKDGKLRELHFDKAMDVLDMRASDVIRQKPKVIHYSFGCCREVLARCRYFQTERIRSTLGFSFSVLDSSFQVLLCVNGRGGLSTDTMKKPLLFKKGDCIFLPAGLGRCHVLGEAEFIKVRC